jgi:hypothetical protein
VLRVCNPDLDPDPNPSPGPYANQVLRVCESTCDRLYEKCASANYEGRGRVDLTFSSGHQLCTAAGVRVVREEDHAVCFSAAAPRRPLAPWWAFAAGAVLTVLTLGRGRAGVL